MSEIVIVGAGDLGREIYYSIIQKNSFEKNDQVIGFVDQNPEKANTELEGIKVYSFDQVKNFIKQNIFFIIGIGNPKFSKKVYLELIDLGVKNWISVFHPTAYINQNSMIGKGVYIGANTTLAINVHVDDHSIINQNCSIGHDVIIGKHSIISPGCIISGRVEIGNWVFIGSGVVAVPGISVGNNAVIGANTLLNKSVLPNHQVMSSVRTFTVPIEESKEFD